MVLIQIHAILLLICIMYDAGMAQPVRTFEMKIPENLDEEIPKWRCSACRVVISELVYRMQNRDPKHWDLTDAERIEHVCSDTILIYGVDLPSPGDTEERYEQYDHFSKDPTIPLLREPRTNDLLQSICWDYVHKYVVDDNDELRQRLSDFPSHEVIYNDYCWRERGFCRMTAEEHGRDDL